MSRLLQYVLLSWFAVDCVIFASPILALVLP
jgi:hypothetical protein